MTNRAELDVEAFAAACDTPAADVVRRAPVVDLTSFEARRRQWVDEVRARVDREVRQAAESSGVELRVLTYEGGSRRVRQHRERLEARRQRALVLESDVARQRRELLDELFRIRARLAIINRQLEALDRR